MPKKILILRFSSIGDIILTTPVVRAIKTQLDDAEVHFCTKEQFGFLMQENPYVDKLHLLKDDFDTLVKTLVKEQFDYVIDLHHNLRTKRLKTRLRAASSAFNKLNWEKWLMVNLKIDKLPNKHIVDRYMEAAAPLGVKTDALGLDYFIPEKDVIEKDWLPETHQKEYVAFAIGGKHATKQLPLKRMIELCDKINKPIILLGGKEDEEQGRKLEDFFDRKHDREEMKESLEELGKKAIIYNACGKFNFNQSASILKGATYVFTHDTGLMHVAAALNDYLVDAFADRLQGEGFPLFPDADGNEFLRRRCFA